MMPAMNATSPPKVRISPLLPVHTARWEVTICAEGTHNQRRDNKLSPVMHCVLYCTACAVVRRIKFGRYKKAALK